MALTKEDTASVVMKFGANEKDTGNTRVQIALLTDRVRQLTEHCRINKKDKSSQRGLLVLVGQRRRFSNTISAPTSKATVPLLKSLACESKIHAV